MTSTWASLWDAVSAKHPSARNAAAKYASKRHAPFTDAWYMTATDRVRVLAKY